MSEFDYWLAFADFVAFWAAFCFRLDADFWKRRYLEEIGFSDERLYIKRTNDNRRRC